MLSLPKQEQHAPVPDINKLCLLMLNTSVSVVSKDSPASIASSTLLHALLICTPCMHFQDHEQPRSARPAMATTGKSEAEDLQRQIAKDSAKLNEGRAALQALEVT